MELISIIVPVYKVEKYLCECIDSILAQTYENFELILVDDGSPDNSGKICDEYAEKDKRIKVIHKENGGVSSARNVGLDNVKGEYITFIDSDDFVEKQYLELMYNRIIETNSDMCFCRCYRLLNGNKIVDVVEKFPKNTIISNEDNKNKQFIDFLDLFFSLKMASYSVRILYKRRIVDKLYFNANIRIGEDFVYLLGALLKTTKICLIEDKLYCYRLNESSAVNTYKKGLLQNKLVLHDAVFEIIEKTYVSKKSLNIYFCRRCFHLLWNELKYKSINKEYAQNIKAIKQSKLYKYFKFKTILKCEKNKRILLNMYVWVVVKFHLY